MRVRELKAELSKLPDNAEVVVMLFDYNKDVLLRSMLPVRQVVDAPDRRCPKDEQGNVVELVVQVPQIEAIKQGLMLPP